MELLTEKNWKLELLREDSIEDFIKECDNIYDASRHTIGYDEVTIDLGPKPVAVGIMADLHLGNEMTNHRRFARDVAYVHRNPRQFVILDGDYCDNLDAISNGYESVIRPPKQKQVLMAAIGLMGNKILGVTQGCHDEWFFKHDSWELSQYIASHCDGYWLGFEGIINVLVGDIKYRFFVRHKYRRSSQDNHTWGMKYKYRKLEEPVDVMVGAHHHYPSIEMTKEGGKDVVFMQTSSYKPFDRFTSQKDIDRAPYAFPGVLLASHKKMIIPFMDIKEAEEFVK